MDLNNSHDDEDDNGCDQHLNMHTWHLKESKQLNIAITITAAAATATTINVDLCLVRHFSGVTARSLVQPSSL